MILCTDRHRTGQPMRALTKEGHHVEREILGRRFLRFACREDAEQWMHDNLGLLDRRNWVYTATTQP